MRLLSLVALVLALNACDAGHAQVRVSGDAAKRRAPADSSRAEPREALPRPSGQTASAPRPPITATAVGGTVSPRLFKPLMADAERFGIVDVRLHPVEGVPAGVAQLVTFGVPFPRGSITAAGLSTLRVLDARGTEIPAFVEPLTPWRHATNAALDNTSVRVARVQIRYTFAATYPNSEGIRVEWGYTNRTQSLASLENPRNGWQPVTSGSFVAGDGVSEPKVYAVLPSSTLSKGLLKLGPMRPFAPNIAATRDDPATMDATEHYPEYNEQMYGAKNFFYAHINEDDPRVTAPNQIPYKAAEGEPWLYDRVSAFYGLYFRSGFFKALRESVRASEYYRVNLYPQGTTPDLAVGTFRLKNPNPAAYIGANGAMYSYPEGLAYTHWTTGDDLSKDGAKLAAKAQQDANDEPDRWSPTSSYTERHMGIKLTGLIVGYELFGDVPYKTGATLTYRERLLTLTANLIWHQNGAGGALPANRVDGGLWKYGSQEGNGPSGSLLVSFWQTPFVVDPMVRAYALTDNVEIAHFIRRTGNALKFGGKAYSPAQRTYRTDVPETLRLVDYVTLIDGSTYAADGAGPEHTLSVAGAVAWAYYFGKLTGQPDDTLKQAANELYRTYDYENNEWTRPTAPASGLTAYRNNPPRRYNWNYKTSGSLSWCLSDLRWMR
ncbi:hypothetical protein GCM10023307_36830 [Lysobacter hankyongensis]|uniref:Cellulase Ig-like domain-containing protein n=1 Tax=Lysobacter hankyongensis TaxID=1176535 RepID=A0ABP9CBU7_9GAMM